jgi:general secretion pathway protein F
MKRFTYEAIDDSGRKVRGSEDAIGQDELICSLRDRKMHPLSVREAGAGRWRFSSSAGKRISHYDLLFLTRELATLLEKDVALERAVSIVASNSGHEGISRLMADINRALRGGNKLSFALRGYDHLFSRFYISMVQVGEEGGVLALVMQRLALYLERSRQVRDAIIKASVYPAFLVIFGMVSVLALVLFVVPKFAQIFNDLNQPMPLPTQIIADSSEFLRQWWWLFVGGTVAAWLGGSRWRRTERGKVGWSRLSLRIPLFGRLRHQVELATFIRALGTLMESGVPILRGLALAGEITENAVVRVAIDSVYQQVRKGRSLSLAMRDDPFFSPQVVHLTAIGEEIGNSGQMLLKLADDLENKLEHDIKMMLALIEPVTIVVMGLVIGGIIITMLLAIFGINDLQQF